MQTLEQMEKELLEAEQNKNWEKLLEQGKATLTVNQEVIEGDLAEFKIEPVNARTQQDTGKVTKIHKSRNVGQTKVLSLGSSGGFNLGLLLALAFASKAQSKNKNYYREKTKAETAKAKEKLTREDFPSRQAWRNHCRAQMKEGKRMFGDYSNGC